MTSHREIYTIGYAVQSLDSFLQKLKHYNITAVADVRSQPYSRFKPEFDKERLYRFLRHAGIAYAFLGKECGARFSDSQCYINGKADYKRIAQHPLFKKGLSRIKTGMQKYRIVLMCAEKDPITCHRTILICRNLRSRNITIKHILADGSLENNKDSEKRLLKLHHVVERDFFITEKELIEQAYDLQGQKIAYQEETPEKQEFTLELVQ